MPSRLDTRLRRLEQARTLDAIPGGGLAVLLQCRDRSPQPVPIPARTDAELGAEIVDLTAQVAAGARGFTPLLLEALEEERTQRQAAVAPVHASGEADPCEGCRDLEEAQPRP